MSIANRKFTDMKQIEFQQSGSSRVEAMLTQPLLEKASTYMCEITDLQATIGEELAFPENEWMFSIVRKPIIPAALDVQLFFRTENLETYMNKLNNGDSTTFVDSEIFGVPEEYQPALGGAFRIRWLGDQFYDNDSDEITAFGNIIPSGEHQVFSRRYYSVLDFVSDLAMQVKQIDRVFKGALTVNAQGQAAPVSWELTDEDSMHYFSLTVDSGGHLMFNMRADFMNDYFIVTSPLFQKVTGYSTFVGKYVLLQPNDVLTNLEEISDYKEFVPKFDDPASLGIDNTTREEVTEELGDLFEGIWYQTAIIKTYSTLVRDIIPVQEGVDVRKKLVVEVSLPISHTLCWDGNQETTKHMLQEFILPSGFVTMGYTSGTDFKQNIVEVRQKQNQGQLVLLNGQSNLALKKLFEGQMQAFRVDLLLDYNRWDKGKRDYVRTVKQLEVGQGGFFYLKLLFTKETI